MKIKFYILILFPLFIGLSFLTLPIFSKIKDEVRREVKLKILKNSISENEFVKFSKKDVKNAKWIDAEEFIINDRLYDVVRIEISDKDTLFVCYEDSKENGLRKYEEHLATFFAFPAGKSPQFHKKNSFRSHTQQLFFQPEHFSYSVEVQSFIQQRIIFHKEEISSHNYTKLKIPPEV